jgi:hypothetical protein
MALGTGLGLAVQSPLFAPYATYTTEGAKSVDSGWYEVYVEPNNGSDGWSTVKTVSGSITIAKAASQASLTRARVYGPYGLTANTGDALGAVMTAGVVFNSRTLSPFGKQLAASISLTTTPTTLPAPPATLVWQGFDEDAAYWYVNTLTGVYCYRKSDSTLVWSNTTPFANVAGLTNISASANHLGGGQVANGVFYLPLVQNINPTAANQYLVGYSTTTGARVVTFSLAADLGTNNVSAIGVDPATQRVWGVDYYTPNAKLYMFDLNTGALLTTYAVPSAWGAMQGCKYNSNTGLIYVTGSRNTGAAGNPVTIVLTTSGKTVYEYMMPALVANEEVEDTAISLTGQIGYVVCNATAGTAVLNYATIPTAPSYGQAGWNAQLDWAHRLPNSKQGTTYGVICEFVPTTLPSSSVLFDNTSLINDHKGYLSSTGAVNGRARSSTSHATATGVATVGNPLTYGWGYNTSTGDYILCANATAPVTGTDATPLAWPTNGDLCIGAEYPQDTAKPNGRYRYFYAFSRAPTSAEYTALRADPFSVWTPTNALTAADKAVIAST